MQEIPEYLKNRVRKDSSKKELCIEIEDTKVENLFSGPFGTPKGETIRVNDTFFCPILDCVDNYELSKHQNIGISFDYESENYPAAGYFDLYIGYRDKIGVGGSLCFQMNSSGSFNARVYNHNVRSFESLEIRSFGGDYTIRIYNFMLVAVDNGTLYYPFSMSPHMFKEPIINATSQSIRSIANENIQADSFRLTESLCSTSNLKFGLCESGAVECTIQGRNDDLKNRWMKIKLEFPGLETKGENLAESDDYGEHVVVTLYSDWMYLTHDFLKIPEEIIRDATYLIGSVYLKCNSLGAEDVNLNLSVSYYNDKGGYYLDYNPDYDMPLIPDGQWYRRYFVLPIGAKYEAGLRSLRYFYFKFSKPQIDIDIEYKNLMLEFSSSSEPSPYTGSYIAKGGKYEDFFSGHIALGRYKVGSVKKDKFGTKSITGYDALADTNVNVEEWYKGYMYRLETSKESGETQEYARQIYATYSNLVQKLGIERYEDYDIELQSHIEKADFVLANKMMVGFGVRYAKVILNNPDKSKLYMITIQNHYYTEPENIIITDDYIFKHYIGSSYYENCDRYGRGIIRTGNVLVDEIKDGEVYNRFVCDERDVFMIGQDCEQMIVHIPVATCDDEMDIINEYVGAINIYTVGKAADLENGNRSFYYYHPHTKAILAPNEGLTARDVIRSLLEVCGCFYRIGRDGHPQFVYASKAALYPSEKLYPSENLYPRERGMVAAMSMYQDFEAEDYEVQDIGKIQIKSGKSTADGDTTAYDYSGDTDCKNTYVIDDNIFYCHKDMDYDYDSMPNVTNLLEGMWQRIRNLNYIPHETISVGLPYVETGDRITLLTSDGGFESFVFKRELSGVQCLTDRYSASGDYCVQPISDYEYVRKV